MRAGLLRDTIGVYKSTITKNEYGEEDVVWTLKGDYRARVLNNGGQRMMVNAEIMYDYTKVFEVYYHVPVDDFDRIKYNNKWYRVLDVEYDILQNKKTIRGELINE